MVEVGFSEIMLEEGCYSVSFLMAGFIRDRGSLENPLVFSLFSLDLKVAFLPISELFFNLERRRIRFRDRENIYGLKLLQKEGYMYIDKNIRRKIQLRFLRRYLKNFNQ